MTKSSQDELVFLPLGGSNEIGMNFNLYGFGPAHARKWIVVDLGVTFGDQTTPGVEIILPDPEYIEAYADDILGIVLTHAHEDHLGAVHWLWPRLKAPVYATPFTAFLLREKLRDARLLDEVSITEVPLGGKFSIGPFDLEMITLTHSIPEPNGLAIKTPLGTILHTGDWKIDPEPQLGEATDIDAIRKLGDEGILAMVCDSTNAMVEGHSGSEAEVRRNMAALIKEFNEKNPSIKATPRAALSRIAEGTHPHVKLSQGDHVVFSSRVIPGNEIPIRNLQNKLADRGVRLHTERDTPGIHVSGHPCRDELKQMYQWARPEIAIPTHGERRHLIEHAAFARDLQVPQQVTPRNGDMVRLAPGRAEIIDEVPAGRLYVDGGVVTAENGQALRERRHVAFNGMLAVSVVLDGKNRIVSGPQVRGLGLAGDNDYPLGDAMDDLAEEAETAFKRLGGDQKELDDAIENAISRAVKKAAFRIWERKPVVETTVLRV
ncbi:MAG: MBL fold metallo-hydrolase [Caulobacter sp. 12-67-6]|nr:MAG: MBL fold metallo-hydrolase [Caulobacter sp. 12-67-6]